MARRRQFGTQHWGEQYANPMADNRTPDQKRLAELQEMAYNELRYWHHLQVRAEVELADIKRQMRLTDHGYEQFLSGELHPMTVSNAVAHTLAYELRFEAGYPDFVKGLNQ